MGIEIFNSSSPESKTGLYYWHREAKSSNAEVDYLIETFNQIVPIEVKAATKGTMRSMHTFLEEKKLDFGIRMSCENFSKYGKIGAIPLYAASELTRLTFEHGLK